MRWFFFKASLFFLLSAANYTEQERSGKYNDPGDTNPFHRLQMYFVPGMGGLVEITGKSMGPMIGLFNFRYAKPALYIFQ